VIVWLTRLFNLIFRSNKMPDEWRWSILLSIFKNKGDVQNCTNYRGIKLMSHRMKLWEMIIEHRFYDRDIDYEGDFLDKVAYGEM
jgi:hypothetical protein